MNYVLEKRRENLLKNNKKDIWHYANIIGAVGMGITFFIMAFLYLLPGNIKAPKFWEEPKNLEVNYMPLFEEIMVNIQENMYNSIIDGYIKKNILENKYSQIYRDIDYYYYKELIPREYLEIFLLSTKSHKELRSTIYSMMIVESGNFTKYIATNTNGTTDHGPLMLNSSNINSDYFKELYFPSNEFLNSLKESDINDIYIKYIPACVSLLLHHLDVYKGDLRKSLKAYNGGPRANYVSYSRTRLNRKTEAYYRKVNNARIENDTKHQDFINSFNIENFENICIKEVRMVHFDNDTGVRFAYNK